MRAINPFSYFVDHASQLRGFGGDRPSPDPQYCFHTRYETVRPGRAIFSLILLGAQATQGEMTVRVHAFRPDFGSVPILAAGGRLDLEHEERKNLSLAVPFHAIGGVEYALYGFFSEPTNLSVDQVEVLLDEPESDAEIQIEPPRSVLAQPTAATEAGPATGLSYHGAIDRARPVSQDCTWRQLEGGGDSSERMARWREAVCRAALSAYEAIVPGIDGWIAGAVSLMLREALVAAPVALFFQNEAPTRGSGLFADFVLWPEGPPNGGEAAARWTELYAWLERLKIGGLAAIGLRYRFEDAGPTALSRNEIRQWALRLIGLGYSLAPLAFADRADLAIDGEGLAACCLIVRRQ
jgi:hypothetical protein|uniref:hypothetical protein n=1 Tax=uncultured Sphingomonas sp. TaxID=158754 RepID=UPI0035CC9AA9